MLDINYIYVTCRILRRWSSPAMPSSWMSVPVTGSAIFSLINLYQSLMLLLLTCLWLMKFQPSETAFVFVGPTFSADPPLLTSQDSGTSRNVLLSTLRLDQCIDLFPDLQVVLWAFREFQWDQKMLINILKKKKKLSIYIYIYLFIYLSIYLFIVLYYILYIHGCWFAAKRVNHRVTSL